MCITGIIGFTSTILTVNIIIIAENVITIIIIPHAHHRLDLFKVIVSDGQARKINTNFTLEQEYHRMRPQLQHCRLGLGNHLTKK